MEKKKVRPVGDLKVIDPETKRHLPPEGKDVLLNSYWRRRLNSNEIELVENKSTVAKSAESKKTEKSTNEKGGE